MWCIYLWRRPTAAECHEAAVELLASLRQGFGEHIEITQEAVEELLTSVAAEKGLDDAKASVYDHLWDQAAHSRASRGDNRGEKRHSPEQPIYPFIPESIPPLHFPAAIPIPIPAPEPVDVHTRSTTASPPSRPLASLGAHSTSSSSAPHRETPSAILVPIESSTSLGFPRSEISTR